VGTLRLLREKFILIYLFEKVGSAWYSLIKFTTKGTGVKFSALIFLAAGMVLGPTFFTGDRVFASSFGDAELGRLIRGEVIVRVDPTGSQKKERVEAAILIDAAAEPIWKLINDCRQTPKFIPGLKSCRVLQQDKTWDLIEHRMQISRLLPEVKYVFRAEYQRNKRIDFKRTSGDLKEFEGSWVLESISGGKPQTLVIYSLFLDAGVLLPQWAMQLLLRQDLPDVLLALRNRIATLPKE
jgi:ribosome-associated toxin RatA of RatAB toxin-antitoxin module